MELRDRLRRDAYEYLEANEFSKALETYRKLVSVGDYSRETLGNLSVCEDQERLAFARKVSNPDEWISRLYEAQVALEIRRFEYAIKICTDVLRSFRIETEDALRVRVVRFRSSCLSGHKKLLMEDFLAIWHSGNIKRSFVTLRKVILRDIARIQHPDMHDVLADLARRQGLPVQAANFINDKARELSSLKTLLESIAK